MTLWKKIALGIGCLFLAGAVLAWLHSREIQRQRWNVLEVPIQLEEGFAVSESFTVDLATDYWIEVEFREPLERNLTDELTVSYAVTTDGRQIAHGELARPVGTTGWVDGVGRMIGSFDAVPGQSYRLDFRVMRSLPQLASTRPVAIVSMSVTDSKRIAVTGSLYDFLAKVLGVVALACFAPGVWALYASARHKRIRPA